MKQSILISGFLVLAILAVVFQPNLSHAPSTSPTVSMSPSDTPGCYRENAAEDCAPYSPAELKNRLIEKFNPIFFCEPKTAQDSIIVIRQAGHDGSGFGYYQFGLRTGLENTLGRLIYGTADVGGGIHIDNTAQMFNTCKK